MKETYEKTRFFLSFTVRKTGTKMAKNADENQEKATKKYFFPWKPACDPFTS